MNSGVALCRAKNVSTSRSMSIVFTPGLAMSRQILCARATSFPASRMSSSSRSAFNSIGRLLVR